MDGFITLKRLKLQNILSYGNEGVEIELQPLNVLIGPNGSGKSNLLEVLRLLQASASDIHKPILQGGGVEEWRWKGNHADTIQPPTTVRAWITLSPRIFVPVFPDPFAAFTGRYDAADHEISFAASKEKFSISRENIIGYAAADALPQFKFEGELPVIGQVQEVQEEGGETSKRVAWRALTGQSYRYNQSIISQRNDPDIYPLLAGLKDIYERFRFYTDTTFGRLAAARKAPNADMESLFLNEDASNLALVLNSLQLNVKAFREIVENLKQFYASVTELRTVVSYGTVQIYFLEEGLQQPIPATRLSDGTLRYLCLLTILCHPNPPPLICIEEPELGMHPDILPTIARLLIAASQRTQLIVTTHSDILISSLADVPEAIIVCDKDEKGTSLKHLDRAELDTWLENYSLGDAWLKGAFGGTRW